MMEIYKTERPKDCNVNA